MALKSDAYPAIALLGDALATLMNSEISPETGPAIELGPRTGAFTCAFVPRCGRAEALIEFEAALGRLLAREPLSQ